MDKLSLGAFGILILIGGYLIGRMTTVLLAPAAPIIVSELTGSTIPVVELFHIEDGFLLGHAEGDVRIFFQDKQILVESGGSLRIPAGPLFTHVITIDVPPDMRFVASKKGRKYYPLASRSGQNIAIENRIYFPDDASAEAAGYSLGK